MVCQSCIANSLSQVRCAVGESLRREAAKPIKYKVHAIPPDGRCFWYSWAAASSPEDWFGVERSKLGYALARVRLKIEENIGESLLQEVMGKMISAAATDEETCLLKEVLDRGIKSKHVTGFSSNLFGFRDRLRNK